MENTEVEWTFEQKAECFRKEIRSRFEQENKEWRTEDELNKEIVLKKDPTFYTRHPEIEENRDSFFWDIYKASIILIEQSEGIRIILPSNYAIRTDTIEMFTGTEVAWTTPSVQAELIDGEARLVISIMLIDTWDDERSRKWKEEQRFKEAYLLRKLRTI